jgi:hypothetical protein
MPSLVYRLRHGERGDLPNTRADNLKRSIAFLSKKTHPHYTVFRNTEGAGIAQSV